MALSWKPVFIEKVEVHSQGTEDHTEVSSIVHPAITNLVNAYSREEATKA